MLMYPYYLCDGDYETFYTFVQADDRDEAVLAAKAEMRKHNKWSKCPDVSINEELVIRGRHRGV